MFLIPILHQTTTVMLYNDFMICCFSFQFYIKPQQFGVPVLTVAGCFSFQFYIKPQHKFGRNAILPVVSHSNSTSNHNTERRRQIEDFVVSHSNSTSNHNTALPLFRQVLVVSHSNSTSNHNLAHGSNSYSARYTYDTDA